MTNYRQHADVLLEMIDVAGKTAIDVGCGNGHIARAVTAKGAHVIAIDPSEKQLEATRAAEPAGDEVYVEGVAEDLDLDDGSADIVIFFNSLHHVPVDKMEAAMTEARRVLKPGGQLYIAEPLAKGANFECQKPFNDETDVRARAQEVIQAADGFGFRQIAEADYDYDFVRKNFEAMRDASIRINPARREIIEANEDEIRERFENFGVKKHDGYHFDQPVRVNLLEKT
jgi:ubiquinone/menaquinone biosynthesis C-methylase UbiE